MISRLVSIPFILMTLFTAACAEETSSEFARTISVSGIGEVWAEPDMATIQVGVSTKAATAQAALDANSTATAKAIATLKDVGVAEKDLQTSTISLYPDYRYDQTDREQKLVGYRATNSLTVKIRDLDKAGKALEAAVGSGANQVNGLSFGFEDQKPLVNEARRKAVEDAKEKAELYAKAAGVKLGPVLVIGEPGVQIAQPRNRALRADVQAEASSAPPVQAGENQVRATINIVYAIK